MVLGQSVNLSRLYPQLSKVFFKLEPEIAHILAMKALYVFNKLKLLPPQIYSKPCKVMNIEFPNPLGLAAGLDKNGQYIEALAALGFGFIEIGTITPKPQAGNPKPRLFRLPAAKAIINRMGFNSKGLEYCLSQLQRSNYRGVLGINIGKNAATPIEQAIDDYKMGLQAVYPYAHYITINISSPNTKNLRELQNEQQLAALLSALKNEQAKLAQRFSRYVPLVVKVAPDLQLEQIENMASLLLQFEIDGLCATNTTINRPESIKMLPHANEQGGLSGAPLTQQATEIIKQFHSIVGDKLPIIGVGGIMNASDAQDKFNAGAKLIQLYSGLIYQGPNLINEILREKNE